MYEPLFPAGGLLAPDPALFVDPDQYTPPTRVAGAGAGGVGVDAVLFPFALILPPPAYEPLAANRSRSLSLSRSFSLSLSSFNRPSTRLKMPKSVWYTKKLLLFSTCNSRYASGRPRLLMAINKHNAGTEDSVYPSDEYNKIFSGLVRAWTGVSMCEGGCWAAGDVKERVRGAGLGGRGTLGGGPVGGAGMVMAPVSLLAAAEGCSLLLPPTPGKEGKEGIKAVTDDHLLEPLPPEEGAFAAEDELEPAAPAIFLLGSTLPIIIKFFNSGGVLGRVVGGVGARGRIHFSKKRMIGRSATIVACELVGELGKGKWITAFACGGGRGGAGGGVVILVLDDERRVFWVGSAVSWSDDDED
jgi:hypothetical protein